MHQVSLVYLIREHLELTTPADHLFVSFNSSNVLMLDQLNPVKDVTMPIMEAMLPMWARGAIPDTSKASKFRVRFEGTPWSSQGTDAIVYCSSSYCSALFLDS
jgi:hypothetical protein